MLTFIEPCLYLERESNGTLIAQVGYHWLTELKQNCGREIFLNLGRPTYYEVHTKIKLTGVAKCNAFLMGWGGRKGLCMCVGTTWVRATSIELQQS